MIALALNLTGLTIPAFIEEVRRIIAAMTGNAGFATPTPPLTDISDSVDTLETTYQLGLAGDHSAKALQILQRRSTNGQMQQLKQYVQITAGDDEPVALSSGMSQKRTSSPHNNISQPQGVRAVATPAAGEARVTWGGVPNRVSYLVYVTIDLADSLNRSKWRLLGTTGNRTFVAEGLSSGVKNGIIIIAVGPRKVQSTPSDLAVVTPA